MRDDVENACAPMWRQEYRRQADKYGLNLKRVSALILEKTEIMRLTLADVLRNLGINDIRATSDPGYAFEMFTERPADLVFSDWSPGLDGIAFLNALRQHPDTPMPYAPVIMVTANTEPRHVIAARDSGMTEYVAKPFTARRIYYRIWEAVARQRRFVRNATFFGPDRRRRSLPPRGPDRRVAIH